MRVVAPLRRLASALVAALVVCASLVGAGHTHASSHAGGPTLSASADAPHGGSGAKASELDCALCAAAARLAHGAASCAAALSDPAPQRFCAPRHAGPAPRSALLARCESRAPPRLG
jgi:hypothetical protein